MNKISIGQGTGNSIWTNDFIVRQLEASRIGNWMVRMSYIFGMLIIRVTRCYWIWRRGRIMLEVSRDEKLNWLDVRLGFMCTLDVLICQRGKHIIVSCVGNWFLTGYCRINEERMRKREKERLNT